MRRYIVLLLAVGHLLLAAPLPAGADAPGPTDFESRILRVDPVVPGVTASMIGGDSFFALDVALSIEVLVIGYRGEPYVRFNADGTVEENRLSPSKYLNEERFGETDVPPFADPLADPEWVVVATDGRWLWHDHRTHLMSRQTLPGSERGDQINEGVIPIFVDGAEVDISVGTFWLGRASVVGAVTGVVIGVLLFILALRRSSSGRRSVCAVALLVAFITGGWQFLSFPSEVGASVLHWLLPVAGLFALAGSQLSRGRQTLTVSTALAALAAFNLLLWGLYRRAGILAAILPTDAPGVLDRATTSMAIVAGALLSVVFVHSLLDPRQQIQPA